MDLDVHLSSVQMDTLRKRLIQATSPYLLKSGFKFADLPESDRIYLEQHSRQENRKRGEVIFKQGAYPVGAYHVISGKVKIYQGVEEGLRQTLYIYSDHDLIAYRQIIAGEVNPVSAALLEDSVLNFIPADVFRKLIASSPLFARNVLSTLAREFTVWMNRMTVFKQFPVRSRLALALLLLYEQYSQTSHPAGYITITRTELAEFVGASLETIVRNLNAFKRDGLVAIQGRQIILKDLKGILDIVQL